MMTGDNLIIPPQWRETADRIRSYRGAARIFLLGASDTGKSTFAHYLINELLRDKRELAFLDFDPGQSTIGPPTTIGLAVCPPPPPKAEQITPAAARFIGTTSPVENLSAVLEGVESLVNKAERLGEMVIDTTGLVSGPVGVKFKSEKIELVKPTHLVAFQRAGELTPILNRFQNRNRLLLTSLPVSEAVRTKSREERIRNRRRRFNAYFENANIGTISLKNVSLEGKVPDFSGRANLEGLLIGLEDKENNLLGLGIIKAIRPGEDNLTALIPEIEPSRIKTVCFASLRLSPDGEEISL